MTWLRVNNLIKDVKNINKAKEMKRRLSSQLMNVDELAQYLGLQKQTIYNWLHQKKISGIKVGGVWRFDKKEVNAWLRARRLSCSSKDLTPQIKGAPGKKTHLSKEAGR